ncbi:competence/damage-inducible protein A [Fulvivirga lutea]|uniref:CinA-like protein n=1 Tax=Fulvivirga lutea TaxID=2810512 RepID=A0A974WGI9_9BACT|nr:competence/damage-inducible protein A [Fulvivirga lutea]QSE97253.1 competence/damage-inducible protein A [Fulvivirga lutea]
MANAKAELLTIGDEILYGQINDTNSQWMSQELDKVGIRVIRKTTVGDNRSDMLQAFEEAENRADIILITGGLGPTNDDLTKPLLAEHFDCGLKMNLEALEEVREFFRSKGKEITPINEKQAELPICAEKVSNTLGTAPGMWLERNGKVFVSMPGVPHEMKKMMLDTVIPKLQKFYKTDMIFHKVIKTIGIGESWLADEIREWEKALPEHIKLAYLPSLGQVKLRLTAIGGDMNQLKADVEEQIEILHNYAGKYIYGYDKDEIQSVVGQMLKEHNLKVAFAESCTGGYVSHLITSIPGSSSYYQGTIIPYHNELKANVLGVKEETLKAHGAVSEETVIEMSNNVRKLFNADIGIAISGIAGPDGGTPEKPVGTVWIAYADGEQTKARMLQLWKDREVNIKATAIAVMNLIRITLSKSIEIKN